MAKYRKKPVVVEAEQYIASTYKYSSGSLFDQAHMQWGTGPDPFIPTLEGIMTVSDGDYVIRGVAGEFYPCKPDIFEATYELVEE